MDIDVVKTLTQFGMAGLMGVLDILCHRFVDDPVKDHQANTDRFLRMMLRPLKEAEFRRFLAFNFIMTLGIGCIGQYIWLYAFDVVGWSNQKASSRHCAASWKPLRRLSPSRSKAAARAGSTASELALQASKVG